MGWTPDCVLDAAYHIGCGRCTRAKFTRYVDCHGGRWQATKEAFLCRGRRWRCPRCWQAGRRRLLGLLGSAVPRQNLRDRVPRGACGRKARLGSMPPPPRGLAEAPRPPPRPTPRYSSRGPEGAGLRAAERAAVTSRAASAASAGASAAGRGGGSSGGKAAKAAADVERHRAAVLQSESIHGKSRAHSDAAAVALQVDLERAKRGLAEAEAAQRGAEQEGRPVEAILRSAGFAVSELSKQVRSRKRDLGKAETGLAAAEQEFADTPERGAACTQKVTTARPRSQSSGLGPATRLPRGGGPPWQPSARPRCSPSSAAPLPRSTQPAGARCGPRGRPAAPAAGAAVPCHAAAAVDGPPGGLREGAPAAGADGHPKGLHPHGGGGEGDCARPSRSSPASGAGSRLGQPVCAP
ncbi:unnamed protein product [Prorocentrum cordatum]|uniref:Uncharacterized protein n=1 Tax=Prorocentrum cordatum TaxID=2364126 RepID=A0ABN9QIE8_9DINO|nr:unnamed protein product [Polarella glacialis]